jgi:hypothetical protein
MFFADLAKYLMILCAALAILAAEIAVGGVLLDSTEDFEIELAVG